MEEDVPPNKRVEGRNGGMLPECMASDMDRNGGVTVKVIGPSFFRRRTNTEKYLILLVILLFVACVALVLVAAFTRTSDLPKNICLTANCVNTAASLLAAMDPLADPCEDFYQFACGSWNRLHTIPDDKSSISTFEVLSEKLDILLKDLLEEGLKPVDSEATKKAKVLYRSCINKSASEIIADNPLKRVLRELGGWPVLDPKWHNPDWSLELLLGELRGSFNLPVVLEQWIGPDDKNSSVNIIQIDQPGPGRLTLPSREYYLSGPEGQELLDAYYKLMVDVAVMLGADRRYAETQMKNVLDFEIELANITVPQAERHDQGLIYNNMTIGNLQSMVPRFNWLKYLMHFVVEPLTSSEEIVVYSEPYLKALNTLIQQYDRRVLTNYAIWFLIMKILPQLPNKYQGPYMEFQKVQNGILAPTIRWKHCVGFVNEAMGLALGALFVRENFPKESKDTALEMIHNIRSAFNELLQENHWMGEDTRAVAEEKANAMNERIGYPDMLTNPEELNAEYEGLNLDRSKFLENNFRILKFEAQKTLRKLRQPVNKDRWTTPPAQVNAFYSPNKNDIVIPAGILQPLFYSAHFPKSLNYGGIGVAIGHEITHGFDDKGRQFDKDGNMKEWWNAETIKDFRTQAQCIVDQYSAYRVAAINMTVNGKNTQGENIADNGGLKQSYRAYKKWVMRNGEEPLLPGINRTQDQLFFLNYAQIWCEASRPEDAIKKIRSSVHSPGTVRVLGPLSNSYEFAKAYNCPLGSTMNPVTKCSVW
ncbi:PREDICTED: neprilysin-2-like [Priapulus caudatus]|uniref:Neprilysin-2-like n=1 Tax=Priapulus caudatus TaxID=37621 RepID=A0ABM1ELT1_PRICU|nr:PREDICTED: neprilysin-2-like [Priapulus caudatus]